MSQQISYGVFANDQQLHKLLITGETYQIEKRRLARRPTHIGELWEICERTGITHLWHMPNLEFESNFFAVDEAEYGTYYVQENEKNVFARISKRGQARSSKLIAFGPYKRWGYWQIDTPQDLLGTIYYLSGVLPSPIQWGIGHVSMNIVQALNEKREKWLSPTNLQDVPLHETKDLEWKLHRFPYQNGYVTQFDKNSAYLAAMTRTKFGEGEPIYCTGAGIDDSKCGFYKITWDAEKSTFNGKNLPLIFEREWATDDLIRQARELGYYVRATEGYQWEKSHRALESFANFLWSKRETFHRERGDKRYSNPVCRENAYYTIKELALLAPGRMAMEENQVYRPDVWNKVVNSARATGLYWINHYHNLGCRLVGVYRDSLFYWSASPDIESAAPGILKRDSLLGGFRHIGTVAVDESFLAVYNNKSIAAVNEYMEQNT